MSLLGEASKVLHDDAYRIDIETKLKAMTNEEQTLMDSAFQSIERARTTNPQSYVNLPNVEFTQLDNKLKRFKFSAESDDKSEDFSVYTGDESEASKQRRRSDGAAEVAKMLRDGNFSDATNRMKWDHGEMSEEDWVSFMKQVSQLAPNQLQLLTPSDVARLAPKELQHLAESFDDNVNDIKGFYLFTTTQPNLFGLARWFPVFGSTVKVLSVGMVAGDMNEYQAGWVMRGLPDPLGDTPESDFNNGASK